MHAAVALFAHLVVLAAAVVPVLPVLPRARSATPSSKMMRKRTIPLVAVAELLVAVVPLALL